jgi:hypothetical protein
MEDGSRTTTFEWVNGEPVHLHCREAFGSQLDHCRTKALPVLVIFEADVAVVGVPAEACLPRFINIEEMYRHQHLRALSRGAVRVS